MAIDDAEKRTSVAAIHFPPFGPGVTPNASPDQEWRQQVGYSYSGIAAASEGGGVPTAIMQYRLRRVG